MIYKDSLVSQEGKTQLSIDKLKIGERLVTFNPNRSFIAGRTTQGRELELVSNKLYTGEIVSINVNNNQIVCTPEHKLWGRFTTECADKYCLYIMVKNYPNGIYLRYQGRVGISRMKYYGGMGVSARARAEGAFRAWILGVYDNKLDAKIAEAITMANFGLPGVVFRFRQYTIKSYEKFINGILEGIGDNTSRVRDCLAYYGRHWSLPAWEQGSGNYLSTQKGSTIYAANLIDGCFSIRVDDGSKAGVWSTATVNRTTTTDSLMYDIRPAKTERNQRLYLANNVVCSA